MEGAQAPAPATSAPVAAESNPEEEVEPYVGWIAAHQAGDGRWEAEAWDRWRMGQRFVGERLLGRGSPSLDVAVTSLTLLAYAGAGCAADAEGLKGPVVAWGLRALRERQDADGAFGDPKDEHWPVNQGLAILALAEHAALRPVAALVDAVRRGVDRYRRSRQAEPARWTDDRVFGGLPAFAWIVLAADEDFRGTIWSPARKAPSGTVLDADLAVAKDRAVVASWITLPEAERTLAKVGAALALGTGERAEWRERPAVVAAAEWLAERAPRWDPSGKGVDAMGWWLGTRGAFAAGGGPWKRWEAAMKPALIDTQRKDGSWCDYKGSWDPGGAGAEEGGRVFMTVTAELSLEIWYRYDKVFGAAGPRSVTQPREAPSPEPVERPPPPRRYSPCR